MRRWLKRIMAYLRLMGAVGAFALLTHPEMVRPETLTPVLVLLFFYLQHELSFFLSSSPWLNQLENQNGQDGSGQP